MLEPLADRYKSEVEWHDLDKADEVSRCPPSSSPNWSARADFVVSINALGGFDFAQGVQNIRRDLKPDGTRSRR